MKNSWILSALAVTALFSANSVFADCTTGSCATAQPKKVEANTAAVPAAQKTPAPVAAAEAEDDDLVVIEDEDDEDIADASAPAQAQKR